MSNKFSLTLALSLIVLAVFGVQGQSSWERSDKKAERQARKRTYIRTIQGQNEVIIATPDEIIVRPALRTNIRPVIVRPVIPRPPVPIVSTNVRVYGNTGRMASGYFGEFEDYNRARAFEGNRFGSVSEVARLNGFRDGVREGTRDASDGDAYDPFGEHAYKDGATGYISKYGNRAAYQQIYRQSFVRGYKESFDRYLGNYDRRNW